MRYDADGNATEGFDFLAEDISDEFSEAMENAGSDDSVLEFDSLEREGIGYADRGAPLSYRSEWLAYMEENADNFNA
jgi:hypothetical protein